MCAYVYVGVLTENNVVFFLGAGASSLSKLQFFEEEIFLRVAFLRAVSRGRLSSEQFPVWGVGGS